MATATLQNDRRQHVFFSINPRVVETQEGHAEDGFDVGTRLKFGRRRTGR
jgi:hypothetical protein